MMDSDQWTVKYAPKSMKDLVGNKSNYTKMFNWLKTFYNTKPSARGKDFKYITLLVGPPGIGKTSGIIAISKDLNYELIEFNASDQRNEKIINKLVGRETKTFVNQGYNGKIVLLDEVDGIQGREDKGGLSALMRVARESIHPIICTANDPQSDKIRSLKKSPITITLVFKKPDTAEMTVLLENIAKREGITVPPKLISVICENARGDIRGAVNDLENLAQKRTDIPMNAIQALSIRDSEVSIDLALRQIFGEAKTLRQAHEVTSDLDVDYSMFMHYIMENIPVHSSYPTELESMYSNAALADLFYGRIMTSQHWKYLKYYFYFLSAGIRSSKVSTYRQSYPKFPTLLMILSRTKKVRTIRNSVTLKFGKLTHCSKNKINNFSLPYIRMLFEQLFELYSNDQLESPKGQYVLDTVSSIHNDIELDEDEFIYLFNDPLFEKQTAAEEKKQKKLIKIIDDNAQIIRQKRISERNTNLNKLLSYQDKPRSITKPTEPKIENIDQNTVKANVSSSIKQKKSSSSKKKKKKEVKTTEDILDTFDQEQTEENETIRTDEMNLDDSKKVVKKKKTVDKKEEKSIKEKEKRKSLFEFTEPKKESKGKKKKESGNLVDFM